MRTAPHFARPSRAFRLLAIGAGALVLSTLSGCCISWGYGWCGPVVFRAAFHGCR
jgi:hypothetical protein